MAIRLVLLLVFVTWNSQVFSQNINPSDNEIYRSGEIAYIYVTMDEADKEYLLNPDNLESNEYQPCNVHFVNSQVDEVANNVGIRLRGNTSRYHPKKSFKIDFREFGGPKFHDFKKFNLKAENNDPSMIREHLSLQIFRMMNVPAARSSHVELYINGEYMGLYLNVEQIDDEFVQERFDDDSGNIYKCYWGATLEDDGQVWDNNRFELKTNEALNDRQKLVDLVNVLNEFNQTVFLEEIEQHLDVYSLVRYFAAEAILGHWDGYSYNKNNFYLYEDPSTGLVSFIPYDVDNTFGIDWVNRDWAERDVLDWPKHGEGRPLVKKVLAQQKYLNYYVREMRSLLENHFNALQLGAILEDYRVLLRPSISRDTYYPQTFGFSVEDFDRSFDQNDLADHLPYGLENYIDKRTETAEDQLSDFVVTSASQPIHTFNYFPNPVINGEFLISGTANDITVWDSTGRLVDIRIFRVGRFNKVRLPHSIRPGLYFIDHNGTSNRIVVK